MVRAYQACRQPNPGSAKNLAPAHKCTNLNAKCPQTMNNTIISSAVEALVPGYLRQNLIPLMLVGATTFTLLYFALSCAFARCTRSLSSATTVSRTAWGSFFVQLRPSSCQIIQRNDATSFLLNSNARFGVPLAMSHGRV